jgi:hypothetical protein
MSQMNKEQKEKVGDILEELIKKHKSLREFARAINEDSSDVVRWRKGSSKIHMRAAVCIAKIYKINIHDLRPDIFPHESKITFKG